MVYKKVVENINIEKQIKHKDSKWWAEGNTNQAFINIYTELNATKLSYIQEIVKMYKVDSMKHLQPTEIINNIANDLQIAFVGFASDFKKKNDKDGLKRWTDFDELLNEPNILIRRTSSLETIVLFLLRQETRILRKLFQSTTNCFDGDSKACNIQIGGSSSITNVDNFIQIYPENAALVHRIFKTVLNSAMNEKYSHGIDPMETNLTDNLCLSTQKCFNVDEHIFLYSNRTGNDVYDVWNVMVYLMSKPKNELIFFQKTLLDKYKKSK